MANKSLYTGGVEEVWEFLFCLQRPIVCVNSRFPRQKSGKNVDGGLLFRRDMTTQKHRHHIAEGTLRNEIFAESNNQCFYCGDPAECIDHIIPWDFSRDSSKENLVASCLLCNGIAGSQIFNNLEEKREYIRSQLRRKKYKNRKKDDSHCLSCGVDFVPRYHGSTLFYCRRCANK